MNLWKGDNNNNKNFLLKEKEILIKINKNHFRNYHYKLIQNRINRKKENINKIIN